MFAVDPFAVLAGGLAAAAVWASTPWMAPRRDPMPDSLDDGVTIFWRPGCVYCARLRVGLWRLGRQARWVNIHADDRAREYVRSANDGDETVPTVVIAGSPHTNPAPALVRAALS